MPWRPSCSWCWRGERAGQAAQQPGSPSCELGCCAPRAVRYVLAARVRVLCCFQVPLSLCACAGWLPCRYLEQVVDTGVGVRRHPLFFLGRFRGGAKKARKHAGGSEDAVTVRCLAGWRMQVALRQTPTRQLPGPHTCSHTSPLTLWWALHGSSGLTSPCFCPPRRSQWRRRMCGRSGCVWRGLRLAPATQPPS